MKGASEEDRRSATSLKVQIRPTQIFESESMIVADAKDGIEILRNWQDKQLIRHRNWPSPAPLGPSNVTILTFFFRNPAQVEQHFPYCACAIYETWRHCGMMKTVIVADSISEPLKEFSERHQPWVEIQEDPSLVPGDVNSMSLNCCATLGSRFHTEYVLIVQDDGFPLRQGLDDFLGKYDFIGSPWRRNIPIVRLVGSFLRHWPSNGGFSLRSKRICEAAACYFERDWKNVPYCDDLCEDMFFTKTLPEHVFSYRFRFNVANVKISSTFAYEGQVPANCLPGDRIPFGFHTPRAFRELHSRLINRENPE